MTSSWGPGRVTSSGRHWVTWRSAVGPWDRRGGGQVDEWGTRRADVAVTCTAAGRGCGRDRCRHIGRGPVR